MEYLQTHLGPRQQLLTEDEKEYASNSYLMSLVALFAGLPLPIFNLIATLLFFLAQRRSTPFVHWHCMQALLSQIFIFFFNTAAFWWTVSVLWYGREMSNVFFGYIAVVLLFNLVEMVSTIYTAIQVRKGFHVRWVLFSDLTDYLLRQPVDAFGERRNDGEA